MRRTIKPGEKAPASGIYASPGRRATIDRGEIAPPTKRPGQAWTLERGNRTNPGAKR